MATSEEIDVERKKSVGTQTSFGEDSKDNREGCSGNVWTNVSTYSITTTSTQTSSSEVFAEICDKILSSENNADSQVNILSSALNKLDTKEREKPGEISKCI